MTVTSPVAAPEGGIVMFSTSWCGYCQRLKAQLSRADIPVTVVDIEHDGAGEAFVVAVNNGNATVPTVVFPDGTAATNPTIADVTRRLSA